MNAQAKPNRVRSEELRLRIRPDEAEALRELAEREDLPVSAIVRAAIRRHVEEAKR